jgi:hypothetical protein
MIIINLLALLVILAAGAVAGVLVTIRYAGHRNPEQEVEEDPPSALASRERLPI